MATLPAAAQNQTWIEQFGTAASDEARAVCQAASGGVFVGGATTGDLGGPSSGNRDAWLARFDDAGDQMWLLQFGTVGNDETRVLVEDGTGGVIACGRTTGALGGPYAGIGYDVWIARFDGNGQQSWILQFGTDDEEWVDAASSDNAGGLYLSGYTGGDLGGPNAGGFDAWVARYDGTGNQMWIRQLGTPDFDIAGGLCADATGGIFVGGDTLGDLWGSSSGARDVWLARYDSAGTLILGRQFGTTEIDFFGSLAADGAGGCFAVGTTWGSLGGPYAGGSGDAWIGRFDSSCATQWISQLGTGFTDNANTVAGVLPGGVVVAGLTGGALGGTFAGGTYDAWVAFYDEDGQQTWIQQLGTSGSGYDVAYDVTNASQGAFYLCGQAVGPLGGPWMGSNNAWIARYDKCYAESYCVGAINSTGQGAEIGWEGSTSVSQNDLTLTVADCPPNQPGIFILGKFQTQVPFGEGWLCLTGGVQRLLPAVFLNPSGAGSLQLDFTNANSPASLITEGSDWQFQFWYRDPQIVGAGFNLSNGLTAHFCP